MGRGDDPAGPTARTARQGAALDEHARHAALVEPVSSPDACQAAPDDHARGSAGERLARRFPRTACYNI